MQYLRSASGLWVPVSDEEIAEQARLARFATMTFGLYGWLKDTSVKCEQAGSGVFIAPNLALTAKHVSNGILSLDPAYDSLKGYTGQEREYDVGVRAYQVPFEDQDISWYTRNNWASKDTDITLVSIYPDTPMAQYIFEKKQSQAYFEWQLEPPPIGATVEMYGYPKSVFEVTAQNEPGHTTHSGGMYWVKQEGTVVDIHEPYRSHGNLTYPCYRLDKPIDHGFSGGPVFYDGAMVGIVSVGFEAKPEENIPPDQYVASLWPLVLMKCHLEGAWQTFEELFDLGVIQVRDWKRFRGNVHRELCDQCEMQSEKHPYHAVRDGAATYSGYRDVPAAT